MIQSLRPTIRRVAREPGAWVVSAAAILYACVVVPQWQPTWDSATYITVARSLVRGDGYSYMGYPHTKYPPGFPLLLTPVIALFGESFLLMRGLVAACAVASLGVAYALVKRAAGRWVAAAATAMAAGSYALLFEATRILSDVPYMLASLVALLALERARQERSWRRLALVAGLCVTAYLVRVVGVTLALAAAISLVRDVPRVRFPVAARHAGVVLGAVVVVVALWMGRNALVRDQLPPTLREALSYERELVAVNPSDPHTSTVAWQALRDRLRVNARYYTELTALLVTSNRTRSAWSAALVLAGWVIVFLRRSTAVEWYFGGYVAVYLLWPAHQGERFLVPVLPMVYYYALVAATTAGDALARCARVSVARRPLLRDAGAAAIAAVFVVVGAKEARAVVRAEHRAPYHQGVMAETIDALVWLGANTPPNAVLVTNRAPYGVLWADRRTYTVPWVGDREEILASIRSNRVTHAVTNSMTAAFLGPVVEANPEVFRPIRQFGSTQVYEVIRVAP